MIQACRAGCPHQPDTAPRLPGPLQTPAVDRTPLRRQKEATQTTGHSDVVLALSKDVKMHSSLKTVWTSRRCDGGNIE